SVLRRTRSCGRGTPGGLSRSVAPRKHFARVIGTQSADLEYPCAQTLHKHWPVRGVQIPNEVSRRTVPKESPGDLARDPLRGRVFRHTKRQPMSPSVPYDDKDNGESGTRSL